MREEAKEEERDKAVASRDYQLDNAFYFADESGNHSGGRYFVVAGVAFTKYRQWIKSDLEHAERASGKGKQDWKGTKNPSVRANYIERVLAIEQMRESVFYAEYLNNDREYWSYTVDALTLAIKKFGDGKHNIVRHQGLNYKSRQKLKYNLLECGLSVEIQSGSDKRAEIRVADGLAGYLGLVRHNPESPSVNLYPDIPDWIIDLKSEAPQEVSQEGGKPVA